MTVVIDRARGRSLMHHRLERVRVPAGAVTCTPIDVARLDVDDAGEPRVLEGTAVIVGREPQLEVAHG